MVYVLMAIVFIVSLSLTGGLRRYALAKNLMDVPNARSSHALPTPRGGGVAFVLAFLLAIPFLNDLGFVNRPVDVVLIVAGLFIAIIGLCDDHGHIAPPMRLLAHFAASIFGIYWLGGMPSIAIFGCILSAGWLLNGLATIYIVWMLNLYNFMDGVDGLAAIEVLSVCVGAVCLYWLDGVWAFMGLPLILAAAVAGFLCWNFPPARIFMGDGGSGFLGFCLGILSIQAAFVNPQLFWGWLILLGVFIVDATATLLRRLARGDKVYEAHCNHAYQHAARRFGSHGWVTLGVLGVNLFWLLPMAILVECDGLSGSSGLVLAYLPLVVLAIKFKAGNAVLLKNSTMS